MPLRLPLAGTPVPAEAFRPRSVPVSSFEKTLRLSSGPPGIDPCLSAVHNSLSGSASFRPFGLWENRFPLRRPVKRNFSVAFRGSFGLSLRFRRTLEGKWVRLSLSRQPRASSFRLPGPRFGPASILADLSFPWVGPQLRAFLRFRRAALCHKKEGARFCRVGKARYGP